jgi:hypothetical protein
MPLVGEVGTGRALEIAEFFQRNHSVRIAANVHRLSQTVFRDRNSSISAATREYKLRLEIAGELCRDCRNRAHVLSNAHVSNGRSVAN